MSISILQQPTDLARAKSPMIYSVSGSNVSQDDYKFLADIFVWQGEAGDIPGSYQYRIAKRPDNISNLYGYFDISKIVESEMAPTFLSGITPIHYISSIAPNAGGCVNVRIKFGETYSSGGVTVLTSGVTDSNIIYSLDGWNPTSANSVNPDISSLQNFGVLSNRPTTLTADTNCKMTMPVFLDSARDLDFIRITYSNGTVVTDPISGFVSGLTDDSEDALSFFPMGVYNLNNSVISTPPSAISNLQWYDWQLLTSSSGEATQVYRVNLECSRWANDSLAFVNQYGGWDYLPILGKLEKRNEGQRSEFSNIAPTYGGSTLSANVSDRYRQVYNVNGKTIYTMNTGWINEGYSAIVQEMLVSEYMQLVSSREALKLTDVSFEYKTSLNNRLINYTIVAETSLDFKQQRFL